MEFAPAPDEELVDRVAERSVFGIRSCRRGSLLLVSWVLGVTGVFASLRGWGPVVMDPAEQLVGELRIGGVTFSWLLIWYLTRRSIRGAQILAWGGAYLTCVPLAAANVGRAPAIVAVTGVFVAAATLVEWCPTELNCRCTSRLTLIAVPPVVAAGISWATTTRLLPTVAGYSAAMVMVEANRRGAGWVRRVEARCRTSVRAIRTRASELRRGVVGMSVRVTRTSMSTVVRWWRIVRRGARSGVRQIRPGGRHHAVAIIAVGSVLLAGLYVYPFWRMVNTPGALFLGINDYGIHLDSVRYFSLLPFRLNVPHFMFHAVSAAVDSMTSPSIGPVVTLCGAQVATFVTLIHLFRMRAPDSRTLGAGQATVAVGLFLVMETPTLVLLVLGIVPPTTRFMSVQALYSPTWVVGLPWAVLGIVLADGVLSDLPGRTSGWDRRWVLAGIVAVSAVAKPSFAVCFLPGFALYLLLHLDSVREAIATIWRVSLPSLVVVGWQTWFLTTGQSRVWADSFVFRPIGGPVYGWARAGWPFWIPMVWLMLALWVTRGRVLSDRLVQLVLCCFVFAVALFLLFRESGQRAGHGNLGVPSQLCVFLLLALALRAIARESVRWWRRHRRGDVTRLPLSLALSAVVLVCFLAGGVLAYLDVVGGIHLPIRWNPFY